MASCPTGPDFVKIYVLIPNIVCTKNCPSGLTNEGLKQDIDEVTL